MTGKTRSFTGVQDDKQKPVILRAVPPPEGSGVFFQESGTRSFAGAQNDNENQVLSSFRPTGKTRSFTGVQDDKQKPVILRAVPPPEGSGVFFQESGTRSFAGAQNDNENQVLSSFRPTGKTRSFTGVQDDKQILSS